VVANTFSTSPSARLGEDLLNWTGDFVPDRKVTWESSPLAMEVVEEESGLY